jgi:hypothetical protein
MLLPPTISLILAAVAVCLRIIGDVLHLSVLNRASDVTGAAAMVSFLGYVIWLILHPENPRKPDVGLMTYLRSFFADWLTGMSGPLSVPFAALAVWSEQKQQKAIWGSLAVVAALFGSYRVWRKERLSHCAEITQLQSQVATLSPSARTHADKNEVLQLLRHGKWTAPLNRPTTGAGFPLVYERELADNSASLRGLGEIGLHNLLLEMQLEGLIDCAEHEGNRWFARYG